MIVAADAFGNVVAHGRTKNGGQILPTTNMARWLQEDYDAGKDVQDRSDRPGKQPMEFLWLENVSARLAGSEWIAVGANVRFVGLAGCQRGEHVALDDALPDLSPVRPSITQLGGALSSNSAAPNVSAEIGRSATTRLEQAIETERRRLLHVHGVLHCLYEVLLYSDGEDTVLYAEAAHLASIMVDESVAQLDSTRIKPLIDALKMESGGHGGGGFVVREPPPPPYLLS